MSDQELKMLLESILRQPTWYSLIKLNEVRQRGEFKGSRQAFTKISGMNLEVFISPQPPEVRKSIAWFVFTNLFLATMDMEHRLEFHNMLTMKTIYISSEGFLFFLNPYILSSYLDRIDADLFQPALAMGQAWKPEYQNDYYRRIKDLNGNDSLRDVHYANRESIRQTLISVALVTLGTLAGKSDESYVFPKTDQINEIKLNKQNIALEINVKET